MKTFWLMLGCFAVGCGLSTSEETNSTASRSSCLNKNSVCVAAPPGSNCCPGLVCQEDNHGATTCQEPSEGGACILDGQPCSHARTPLVTTRPSGAIAACATTTSARVPSARRARRRAVRSRRQSSRRRLSTVSEFVLVHGAWKPIDARCLACGKPDALQCHPGDYPKCFSCRAIILRLGRAPSAECATPNGRVDGHMAYVRMRESGEWVCAFCGRGESEGMPKGCVPKQGHF